MAISVRCSSGTFSVSHLWHDGEARNSKDAYLALPSADQPALIKFLASL